MTSDTTQRHIRLAGLLMTGGMLAELIVTAFHPASADPNDHVAVFAEYARDGSWTGVHLGQFIAGLVVLSGLVVLHRALTADGRDRLLPSLAVGAAAVTAAALALLQAVDGGALKHAVDAWAGAPPAQKSSAFADAQMIRWLEWGANGLFRLLQSATVALFGLALVRSPLAPRAVGAVAIVAGTGYAVLGVIVAGHGFSPAALNLGLALDPLFLAFALGLVITGFRDRPTLNQGRRTAHAHAHR